MKTILLVAMAGLTVLGCAQAESAHKGWGTVPAEWPGTKSPRPIVHSVGLVGPWAPIAKPDPSTNAPLQAGYASKPAVL